MFLPTKLYVVPSDTVESFFSSVSNGLYDIKGSNVTEWLKLPWSRHDVYRMALTDRRLQSNKKEKPFAVRDISFLHGDIQLYLAIRQGQAAMHIIRSIAWL